MTRPLTALLLLAVVACGGADEPAPPADQAAVELPAPQPELTLEGIGGVAWGATVDEVAAALGQPLEPAAAAPGSSCRWASIELDGDSLLLMVHDGRVVRADVRQAGRMAPGGGRVGSTVDEVRSAQGAALRETPHKYVDGLYLTALDPADTLRRLVLETNVGGRVTEWRVGRMPEVGWVEGCS